MEDGKPKNKYISPYGDRKHLYFVPGCAELVMDSTVPIILVESEKAALALTAWAERTGRKILPVAIGGCWGWRGRIGKTVDASGARVDEVGPLPELLTLCTAGRTVYVLLDANAATNIKVRVARAALVRVLRKQWATVTVLELPQLPGVNGPDDLVAVAGDNGMCSLFGSTRAPEQSSSERLIAETPSQIGSSEGQCTTDEEMDNVRRQIMEAEAVIHGIADGDDINSDELHFLFRSLAAVDGRAELELLIDKARKALKGRLSKDVLRAEVNACRIANAELRQQARKQSHEAAMAQVPVIAAQLIDDLEKFFNERAHLPATAGLVLAYFALNTGSFQIFDTVPYISLESAVPACGKSTVLRLLEAVVCRARKATSLSEAVMFRLIDAESPTLLIDEAETIEGRSERAEALRALSHEGYKKGGRVARCEGDDHEVRWFDVFCPKVFAAIGGVSGALLDRCLVIHMEKAPKGSIRKSTRYRTLRRDTKQLVERLEAYAVQMSEKLRDAYEHEPDSGYWPSITDREAELCGPLLIHAKLAGPAAEARLLEVVTTFGKEKAAIQSSDWQVAQAIDLLEAITKHNDDTFTPGDLVPALAQSEAWAKTFSDVKGKDDASIHVVKAAKIGYVLSRRFRLHRKKNSSGKMAYDRKVAIDCLAAHVPQTPPDPPGPPPSEPPCAQSAENRCSPERMEATEGLSGQDEDNGKGKSLTQVGRHTVCPRCRQLALITWSDGSQSCEHCLARHSALGLAKDSGG